MKNGKEIFFYIFVCILILSLTHWGSQTITVLGETSPPEQKKCIIVDAGHGGVDGGAVSCTGISESTYNLEISLRLRDLLRLMGYQVNMIRETDISVYTKGDTIAQKKVSDLKHRAAMVGEWENPVLLSIHQNNFSDSRYSGAQVFYANTQGSRELAEKLQSSFCSILNPGSRRQVKKASGIYLMEHIQCPAVLIECGFLSNSMEEAKLRSPQYQKNLCCVVASNISQYLSNT